MLNKPIFDEASHTYRNSIEGWYYTSGTTLVGKYKPKFDGDYWSLYNAGRRILGISDENKADYSKLLLKCGINFGDKTISNLKEALKLALADKFSLLHEYQVAEKQNWATGNKASTDAGTRVHKEMEDSIKGLGIDTSIYGLNVSVVLDLIEIDNLFKLPDGVHCELMLWNNEYRVAGISDKVTIETIGNIRYVDIDDYKTNKKIETQSYQNKLTGDFNKMLFPVNDLMDCNFIHYSLQLSLYAYLLECFGYKLRSIKFTHLPLNEEKTKVIGEQTYFVTYLREYVIKMLNHHRTC